LGETKGGYYFKKTKINPNHNIEELIEDFKKTEGREPNLDNLILIGISLSGQGACQAKVREQLILNAALHPYHR
jgi:uncharacterized protein (DUF2342 family)